ncbi:MAG: hypothetical protein NC092_05315 [Butyrivibrio sp.]|nr:hypothetical protein [Muribaculum sp.]MCM1552094.1 hypothetical protein [Butyrivibrio sp.]
MKDTAPTMEEITEVNRLREQSTFQELQAMEFYRDSRKAAIVKNMTVRLMQYANDANREKVWKLCKKLASYTHAPVKLKDYQRMKPYAEDEDIVDVILSSLRDDPYPFGSSPLEPIQGYYYAIAVLSQSEYKRAECLELLTDIAEYFKVHQPDELRLLERNMDVLKSDYPDLAKIIS